MKGQAFRNLAIDLLDDAQGINKTAWKTLANMLDDGGNDDIVRAVKTQDKRFYLPSEAAAELRQVENDNDDEDEDDDEGMRDDEDEEDE